ncbi:MAG: hypothetical protein II704_06335 [Erysipelotrichaceae bacterium]|nr:hypothetical protein [Erysipelotrichaceae bacterium]
MIAEIITELAVGAVLCYLGWQIWKRQKISLLHSYHYRRVTAKDIPAYTRQMGLAQIVMGTGLALAALLRIFTEGFLPLAVMIGGFAIGLVMCHKAQMKYNGSWFS